MSETEPSVRAWSLIELTMGMANQAPELRPALERELNKYFDICEIELHSKFPQLMDKA